MIAFSVAPIVGHVGDGNFHVFPLVMMEHADEVARAHAFIDGLTERALVMEGTRTGEHGIGQGKRRFLEPELGATSVAAMRSIKTALDPVGIMNPGKIFQCSRTRASDRSNCFLSTRRFSHAIRL
jgi:D-lactate dehydrogenase (cytochrome)